MSSPPVPSVTVADTSASAEAAPVALSVVARRSGRVTKKPARYEPEEVPEDDYSGSEESGEGESQDESMSEDERSLDESDTDCSFVVDDSEIEFSTTDEEDEDEEGSETWTESGEGSEEEGGAGSSDDDMN